MIHSTETIPSSNKLVKYLPWLIIPLLPLILSNYPYGIMLLCFAEIYIATTDLYTTDIVGRYHLPHQLSASVYGSALLHTFWHSNSTDYDLSLLFLDVYWDAFRIPGFKIEICIFINVYHFFQSYCSPTHYAFAGRNKSVILTGCLRTAVLVELVLQTILYISIMDFFDSFTGCFKMMFVPLRVGRAFLAIKQNQHAAEGMGIDSRKYKVYAFEYMVFTWLCRLYMGTL